jgi:hypothetical protein
MWPLHRPHEIPCHCCHYRTKEKQRANDNPQTTDKLGSPGDRCVGDSSDC